ncbi:EboA domain-containing protein [Streptomyces sp. NPDC048442]|uniref:EboA domain-containing protein n=1 Tax=Streptomyces sp. NPDC048442 TaxID=3154823 RepID=UPI00342C944B
MFAPPVPAPGPAVPLAPAAPGPVVPLAPAAPGQVVPPAPAAPGPVAPPTPARAPTPTPTPTPDPATAARILLLCAAHADRPTTHRLYTRGTAAERRAVLLALPHLEHARDGSGLPLVEDALRTNDTRLVAAALGPYAATHLDPHAWRHAVLKCLFTEVPVDTVHALAHRARGDTELARMLTDYAAERTAAGRPVPADLHHVLAVTAQTPAPQTAAPQTPAPQVTRTPAPAPEAPSEES